MDQKNQMADTTPTNPKAREVLSPMRPVRGTQDFYGERAKQFERVITVARTLARKHAFSYLEVPIIEFAETYMRNVGESSDIVSKEIYAFDDRGGDKIALRPEFTAGVMRAVVSNKLQDSLPLKLFSYGPVFRYDRPQRGRYRQFHQLNFEVLGVDSPVSDFGTVSLALDICRELGIKGCKLSVNSLGDKGVRGRYEQELKSYLQERESDLSEDSQRRLKKNPLRILDSKSSADKSVLENAPLISSCYDDASRDFFAKFTDCLREAEIDFCYDQHLVRGLDYYDHVVFEIITEALGAQGTVLGGGRYNGVAENFGAKAIPGFGFGGGIERLMELAEFDNEIEPKVAVLCLDSKFSATAFKALGEIRKTSAADLLIEDFGLESKNALKKLLSRANKLGFTSVLIVGESEVKRGTFTWKNLDSGEQKETALEDMASVLDT